MLPSGKASAEQLTAKVYHLAGCATMADPTRTSGSFSPVSCRCLLSSWLRPHWGISQEKLPLDPGFFQFVYNMPRRGKALLGALLELLVAPTPRNAGWAMIKRGPDCTRNLSFFALSS